MSATVPPPAEEKKDWIELNDHVEKLLREGKRSGHEDFRILFSLYGQKKIAEIAQRILKKWEETRG